MNSLMWSSQHLYGVVTIINPIVQTRRLRSTILLIQGHIRVRASLKRNTQLWGSGDETASCDVGKGPEGRTPTGFCENSTVLTISGNTKDLFLERRIPRGTSGPSHYSLWSRPLRSLLIKTLPTRSCKRYFVPLLP